MFGKIISPKLDWCAIMCTYFDQIRDMLNANGSPDCELVTLCRTLRLSFV